MDINYTYSGFDFLKQEHEFKLGDSFVSSACLLNYIYSNRDKVDEITQKNLSYCLHKLDTLTIYGYLFEELIKTIFLILLKNRTKEITTIITYPPYPPSDQFTLYIKFLDGLTFYISGSSYLQRFRFDARWMSDDFDGRIFEGHFSLNEFEDIIRDNGI